MCLNILKISSLKKKVQKSWFISWEIYIKWLSINNFTNQPWKEGKIYWNTFRCLRQLDNERWVFLRVKFQFSDCTSWSFMKDFVCNVIAIYVTVKFNLLHDFNHFHAVLSAPFVIACIFWLYEWIVKTLLNNLLTVT